MKHLQTYKIFENLGFDLEPDAGLEVIKQDEKLWKYLGEIFGTKKNPLTEWYHHGDVGDNRRFFSKSPKSSTWLKFISDNGHIYLIIHVANQFWKF